MITEINFRTSILFLKQNGYEFKHILDIGCNTGVWTMEMKQYFPQAEYLMIDAKDYPQRDKHSPFIQAILSKEKGEVDWYDIEGGNGAGNSYYKETTSHYAETAPVKRTCTTLNILFEENKITNDFDFIKIDVQGAELDILAGASKLLDNAQVILLEVPFVGEVNKNAPRFLDYISFMDKIGFTCYDLVEIHRHYGMLLQVDIMFIKKNHPILERMQNTIHQFGKI